jgi:DNA-binding GntR family transcriptional regulator
MTDPTVEPSTQRAHVVRRGRDVAAVKSPAADQVAERIRWMIVDGTLRPGQKVAQDALSLQLGVSRIPVREALIQMERDGLIVARQNVGAFVGAFDESVIRDHFEVLALVQAMAAERTSAQADRDVFAHLGSLRDAVVAAEDPRLVNDLAVQFQRTVNLASNSTRLRSVLRGLSRILPVDIFVHVAGSLDAQQTAVEQMYVAIMQRRRLRETYQLINRLRADLIVTDLRTRGTFR